MTQRKYIITGYVDYDDTTATIAATATADGATVTGTGTFSVNAGENLHYITVTAPDGTTKISYRVTIVRPLSTWPHLKDLTLDGVTIDNFTYHNYEYVTKLGSTKTSVVIGATPFNASTTVTGTGTKTLVRGGNDFTVKATSLGGRCTRI